MVNEIRIFAPYSAPAAGACSTTPFSRNYCYDATEKTFTVGDKTCTAPTTVNYRCDADGLIMGSDICTGLPQAADTADWPFSCAEAAYLSAPVFDGKVMAVGRCEWNTSCIPKDATGYPDVTASAVTQINLTDPLCGDMLDRACIDSPWCNLYYFATNAVESDNRCVSILSRSNEEAQCHRYGGVWTGTNEPGMRCSMATSCAQVSVYDASHCTKYAINGTQCAAGSCRDLTPQPVETNEIRIFAPYRPSSAGACATPFSRNYCYDDVQKTFTTGDKTCVPNTPVNYRCNNAGLITESNICTGLPAQPTLDFPFACQEAAHLSPPVFDGKVMAVGRCTHNGTTCTSQASVGYPDVESDTVTTVPLVDPGCATMKDRACIDSPWCNLYYFATAAVQSDNRCVSILSRSNLETECHKYGGVWNANMEPGMRCTMATACKDISVYRASHCTKYTIGGTACAAGSCKNLSDPDSAMSALVAPAIALAFAAFL